MIRMANWRREIICSRPARESFCEYAVNNSDLFRYPLFFRYFGHCVFIQSGFLLLKRDHDTEYCGIIIGKDIKFAVDRLNETVDNV